MTDMQIVNLKKERGKLLDAWRIASSGQKNSILMRISDIDEDLEEYLPASSSPKQRKFTKNNIQLLKQV
ncbi:MAG: hypothetical protein VR72_18735 [Clostridiaceae bacterium BRH_c20a]|nr:MAG: hypothetical protein VR72_18735 [Clostridiaceae bacterium BRH_c20a]